MISQPTPCPSCGRIYKTVRGMSDHFRKFPDHKIVGTIPAGEWGRMVERAAKAEAERDEYERRWEEDARPAFAIIAAMERLADKFGATPDWNMSHRNIAASIRTALAEED